MQNSDLAHVSPFLDLIDSAKLSGIHCTAETRSRFGEDIDWILALNGLSLPFKRMSMMDAISTPEKVRDILLRDWEIVKGTGKGGEVFWPPPPPPLPLESEGDETNEPGAAELLRNLTNPTYTCDGCIPRLPSISLLEVDQPKKSKWTAFSHRERQCPCDMVGFALADTGLTLS